MTALVRPSRRDLPGLAALLAVLVLLQGCATKIEESAAQRSQSAEPAAKPVQPVDRENEFVAADAKGEWLLFRGNAEQTGVASSKLPDKLVVLWTFLADDAFENAVAVSGGVVFAGSMDEHFYAIDLRRGKQKWKLKAAPFKAAPIVRDGFVYAGDVDGYLHCIDAAKGKMKWSFDARGEPGGANFHGNDVLCTSHDGNLYCVTKDGKQRWKFKTEGEIHGALAVADGKTFVGGCDSRLHVIDAGKGKEIRSVPLRGQTGATGSVLGNHLYIGTMSNTVLCVDWKKGEVVWTYKPGGNGSGFFSSPAVNDRFVVIGSRDNRVHAIDRKKGTPVWTFPTGGDVDSSPVIAGNRVVAGSLDSHLYVLDLANGKLVQKLTLDSPVKASPVVVGGKVLVGTEKGTLYCLGGKK
jgi:outer membrane protein assembly factor BamB